MDRKRTAGTGLVVLMGVLALVADAQVDAPGATAVTPVAYRDGGVLMPNAAAKSLMTPSAWGFWGNAVFVGAAYSNPQVYEDDHDSALAAGIGFGDPVTNLGVQLSFFVFDVDEFDNFAGGFKLHRYLGHGIGLAVGGENLFADKDENAADESYYLVVSRASQRMPTARDPHVSRLHVSLGFGSGHYARKSDRDEFEGKGRNGTVVFGAVAYELFKNTNLIVDWNGINLAAGVGICMFEKVPVGIMLGAADLTSNSGDGVRFIASVAVSY